MFFLIFICFLVITCVVSMMMYRFHGKKQLFHLDIIQFYYLFIAGPLLFIWGKTFLFFILKQELGQIISLNEFFLIDTLFSLMAFLLFAPFAIHTITKQFSLRKNEDPEFDIFHLSEYFHLWWSHVVIYLGTMVVVTFLSITNILVPIIFTLSKSMFLIFILLSVILGVISYVMIWNSDPKQERRNFMKLMKLFYGFFFTIHAGLYFFFTPKFGIEYGAFWFGLSILLTGVICSMTFQRSKKAHRLKHWLVRPNHQENVQLFLADTKN